MSKEQLDEREFELINYIGLDMPLTQRDLSRQLNLSLGAVNMLIKKLITKGYIKIVNLNKNKVQYLLTPQGFSEKMRKSINYTLKTINSIGLIKNRVKDVVNEQYALGEREFYTLGNADLTNIVEFAFQELNLFNTTLKRLENHPRHECKGVVFLCDENISFTEQSNGLRYLDLIQELAKDTQLANK